MIRLEQSSDRRQMEQKKPSLKKCACTQGSEGQ